MSEINFPSQGNDVGDTIEDSDSGRVWAWDGEKWELRAKPADITFTAEVPIVRKSEGIPDDEVRYVFNISMLPKLNES